MNEKVIELPSGGRVWVTMLADHRQAKALRRIQLQFNRFTTTRRDENGGQITVGRTDLSREEQIELDDLTLESDTLAIRIFTTHWENVRAPNGDELAFPDDVDRMQEPDFQALSGGITDSLLEGRGGSPNGQRPSGSSSRKASSRPTRNSAKTSSTS